MAYPFPPPTRAGSEAMLERPFKGGGEYRPVATVGASRGDATGLPSGQSFMSIDPILTGSVGLS